MKLRLSSSNLLVHCPFLTLFKTKLNWTCKSEKKNSHLAAPPLKIMTTMIIMKTTKDFMCNMRIRLYANNTANFSPHHLHQRRCSCLSLPLMMWTQLKLPKLYTHWSGSRLFKNFIYIVENTTREENVHHTIELFFVMRRPYIWSWCRSWE